MPATGKTQSKAAEQKARHWLRKAKLLRARAVRGKPIGCRT
jgi:hypothetical protein